jgi:hypothetical protein
MVDLSLLCIMFLGVLHKKNATYLWRMLYLQGIFWILTAIATEVPSVVSLRRLDAFSGPLSNRTLFKVLPFMNMNGVWESMTIPLIHSLTLIYDIRCVESGE